MFAVLTNSKKKDTVIDKTLNYVSAVTPLVNAVPELNFQCQNPELRNL